MELMKSAICKDCPALRWYTAMRKAQKKWEAAHTEERREYHRAWQKKRKIAQNVHTNGEITPKTPYLNEIKLK